MRRRTVIGIAAGLAAPVAAPVTFIIETEKFQRRRNRRLVQEADPAAGESRTLVVYFSRSGNTELMALEIAKAHRAQVVELLADDYRIGFFGWLAALRDSQNQQAVIHPETIDLTSFDTVFLGSPVWWYSPAPPLWQFVSANDFSGKTVVLFNTFNSRFKPAYIDAFKSRIEARGGRFGKHLFVRRGRMPSQLNPEEMLEGVRRQLALL